VDRLELLLGDVAVIAFQLLLGAELLAVVGKLAAAPLAVLAGPVFTLVVRALRPAPNILAEPAVDLMLRVHTFRHSQKLQSRIELARGLVDRLLLEPNAMKGGSLRSRPRLQALQTLREEAPPAFCYTECPESVNWR